MQRILEPELMDEPQQALAYARADFADVNRGFVDRFRRTFPTLTTGRVLDVGCGPADIPVRLVHNLPGLHLVAVDGSAAMLECARSAIARAAVIERVHLVGAHVPPLPFRAGTFDAVISNSLLHHLSNPDVFWQEVRRIGRPGAPFLVMDLLRPDSQERAHAIVESEAANEHPLLKDDFFRSLLAAFTVDEVRAQLRSWLAHLESHNVGEHHLVVSGRLPGFQ